MIRIIILGILVALTCPNISQALELSVTPAEAPEDVQKEPVSHQVTVPYGVFTIDGDLGDWNGEPIVELGGDSEDLSIRVWLAASGDAFYLAVDVTDDVFENTYWGDDIWRGDSVQFAIDPLHSRTAGHYDGDDHEIGLALAERRPLVWRSTAPHCLDRGAVRGANLAVVRSRGHTIYELELPYRSVEYLYPAVFSHSGFNLVVNDSDSRGERDNYLAWTSGIADGKNPAAFQSLLWPTGEILKMADAGEFDAWVEQGDPFAPVGTPHRFRLAVRSQEADRLFVSARVAEDAEKTEFPVPHGLTWYDLALTTDGDTAVRLVAELGFMDAPLGAFTIYRYREL